MQSSFVAHFTQGNLNTCIYNQIMAQASKTEEAWSFHGTDLGGRPLLPNKIWQTSTLACIIMQANSMNEGISRPFAV